MRGDIICNNPKSTLTNGIIGIFSIYDCPFESLAYKSCLKFRIFNRLVSNSIEFSLHDRVAFEDIIS